MILIADGYTDLFIGGRATYLFFMAKHLHSYLLMNDGTGKFKDVTRSVLAKELTKCWHGYQVQHGSI